MLNSLMSEKDTEYCLVQLTLRAMLSSVQSPDSDTVVSGL